MGLFEELIILVKETIEEVNERQRKKQQQQAPPTSSVPIGGHDDELARVRERLAQRAAQQQMERAAALAHAEAEAAAARPKPQPKPQPRPVAKALKLVTPPSNHASRLGKLVRQPGTLRELVLLREILDKPLALRPRR